MVGLGAGRPAAGGPSVAEPRSAPETVTVGRVRRAHGVRGALLVEVLSDVPDRLAAGRSVVLVALDGERRPVRILAARPHGSGLLLELEGLADRDEAAALGGARLEVAESEVPAAPEGAYWLWQLVGCRCRDRRRGDLGRVGEVVEDGGGLLLEIEGPRGRLLVPFVAAYVVAIDVERSRIETDLPEGLIESCASTS